MPKQFEELPENVQALMLAKLAIELRAAKAPYLPKSGATALRNSDQSYRKT